MSKCISDSRPYSESMNMSICNYCCDTFNNERGHDCKVSNVKIEPVNQFIIDHDYSANDNLSSIFYDEVKHVPLILTSLLSIMVFTAFFVAGAFISFYFGWR